MIKPNYSELNPHLLLSSSMQLFLYYRAIDNKGQVVLGRTIMISWRQKGVQGKEMTDTQRCKGTDR